MVLQPAFAALLLAQAVAPSPRPMPARSPLELGSRVTVERRVAAADGTVRIVEEPARGAVPGDRLTVTLAYRNTGAAALAGVVIANPVPAGLAYRGPAAGSPEPDVSTDGRSFAPLASLVVRGPAGMRAATPDDVTHVRWRLDRPLAPAGGGRLGFRATIR